MVSITGIQRVIWDWNGTILDDTEICCEIANQMRAERGMRPLAGTDEYRTVFGFPIIEYYGRMGYTFAQETYEDVSVELVSLYKERVKDCPLQKDALAVLAFLKAKGVRQVLLSATGQEKLLEQTARYPLAGYFDEILGTGDDLAYSKASLACDYVRRAGAAESAVLFVGDTDHDHEVADAAGCRSLLLASGHQHKAALLQLGVPVADSIADVPAYLGWKDWRKQA